jgi:hypothetical protein
MDMKLEVSAAALMELAKEILSGRFAPKDIIPVGGVDGWIEFAWGMKAEVM